MPPKVDLYHVLSLEELLTQYPHLSHLKVRKYGQNLILHSVAAEGPLEHARLTLVGQQQWQLSLPHHTGRWEKTPFVDTQSAILAMLVEQFNFYLHP